MSGRSGIVADAIPMTLFIGAGILNPQAWLIGPLLPMVGLLATLVAPVHGIWMGSAQPLLNAEGLTGPASGRSHPAHSA